MRDDENPEDGECDICEGRAGNQHLACLDVCDLCILAPSLRSETARLRALLDERTALLRECEAEFRALAWSGTDYAENPVCPSCYAEWWDADEVESENDRPKHYSDCDLNNVIRRIETTLKETTCDS